MNKTKINLEIITNYEEARLCLQSCKNYRKQDFTFDLVFDIGGGSTELILTNLEKDFKFLSIPYGVINLDEKFQLFKKVEVIKQIESLLKNFLKDTIFNNLDINAIGSCGTATSICAIFQKLKFYEKKKVENYLMSMVNFLDTSDLIDSMTDKEKLLHPCIGIKRKKMLDNGILILKIISNFFSINNILISDKGIKEGIIIDLIQKLEEKNEKN